MILDEVTSNGDGIESNQPNGTLNRCGVRGGGMANASCRDNNKRRRLESSVSGVDEMISTDGLSGRSRVLFPIMMIDDDDDCD